jgi:hypothetical protein
VIAIPSRHRLTAGNRSLAAGALLLMLLPAAAGAQAAAVQPARPTVDPFYSSRLREGISAAERGAWPEAVASLRVACFGMLDARDQLAECLVRLGLAQAAAGDRAGFDQTFRRLQEGEDLLGLYSRAELPADLQGAFEARAVEWVPAATLDDSPGFAHLASGRQEAQLAGLAPRARRSRLQELAREEPRDPRWPLLLARLEREEGEPAAAVAAAEQALLLSPQLAEARCLRGWGRAEQRQWQAAGTDLAGCGASWPELLPAELLAHVELRQWAEARAVAAALTAEQRRGGEVAKALRRLDREAPPAAAEASLPAAGTPQAAAAPAATPTATPPPPPRQLSAADESAFARVRAQLAGATSPADVERAYTTAVQLAGRYPDEPRVQHLAAESAYRSSRWQEAVRHFRQGGDPGEDQPLLLFYLAVALWESGDHAAAADVLQRCDGRLRQTPFVEAYRRKILAAEPAG